ncbi:MAG: beta-N-acetylglucosaminidase domain-containing protein [Caulobacterales bacterium]
MDVELGIIEGYYGAPWSWAEREAQARFLAPHGYSFFIYAPKADAFLRRRWREDYPKAEADALAHMAGVCKAAGVAFGVGFSPYEVYKSFDEPAREALGRKLAFFDAIGVEILGILFDDMPGDFPDLAATQGRIIGWMAERSAARRIIACPTYYTDDPALARISGPEPPRYLEDLGAALDARIDLFWTGEEVCSLEYSPGHLARIAGRMGRKPVLWDNYPVNDGPRMSPFLHLRAFTGRPAAIAGQISAHAVNPALQPVLTQIPALSLAESYRLGEAYEYGQAFAHAAEAVLGSDLARAVGRNLNAFQDMGLDRLGDGATRMRQRYAAFDHPGAREIVAWLDGQYRITREMIEAS